MIPEELELTMSPGGSEGIWQGTPILFPRLTVR